MAPTPHQSKTAKSKLIAGGKQPKARIARYLKTTEPQLVEGAKVSLLLKGIRCSDSMSSVLRDLRSLQAPHAKLLSKNNLIVPFDDAGVQSLEFLTTKNDASLFAMASHNKKRPNNIILGRTFDRRLLDMVELHIMRYRSTNDFPGLPKKRPGSKPLLHFVGDPWQSDPNHSKLQNLLVDFYKGDPVESLVLSGLDHVIVFTAVESTGTIHIHQRTYYIKLKRDPNGSSSPMPHLSPSGPDIDFTLRRTRFASPDVWKLALRRPKGVEPKKRKNRTTNLFGETVGRLHLERQDLDKRTGKKARALKLAERMEGEEENEAVEMELGREGEEIDEEFRRTFGYDRGEGE